MLIGVGTGGRNNVFTAGGQMKYLVKHKKKPKKTKKNKSNTKTEDQERRGENTLRP